MLCYHCLGCSVDGAIFKLCGSTCIDTCSSRKMNAQIVCSPHCKPGCACPAGQVRIFDKCLTNALNII